MNKIEIYQHPFVDVFKVTRLTEWSSCHKEGDVQPEIWDKELAKNYIRIQGVSSSANYIQIPSTKHLPKKSLGLTGKFVYLQIQKIAGKNFVIHLDYMINETRLTKISLSNMYKEFKNVNGSSLQVPILLQGETNKWSIVQINVLDILKNNNVFMPQSPENFFLRSIQICSTINLKGIFTSDICYQVQTLPKDMQFKIPKDQDWFASYNWITYPSVDQPQQAIVESPKKVPEKAKKVQFKQKVGVAKTLNSKILSPIIEQSQSAGPESGQLLVASREFDEEKIEETQGKVEKTMKEIYDLKEEYKLNLEVKAYGKDPEVIQYDHQALQQQLLSGGKINDADFTLRPYPLLRLDRVVGWHPNYNSSRVYFNKDPKLSNEIIFSQADLLLAYYPPLQKQRVFNLGGLGVERKSNNIDQLFVESCFNADGESGIRSFAFTICKSSEEKAKDNEVTVWDLCRFDHSLEKTSSLITFKPPLRVIHSVSLSKAQSTGQQDSGEFLCLGGKDHQMRDLMLVYKFNEMLKFGKTEIFARQLIDFEAITLQFHSQVSNSIIACGKENIKIYKIKNGHLPSQSISLNNTGRGKYFCQIFFYEKNQQFSCGSSDGLIFTINYQTRQVEKVFQIHEEPIQNIVTAKNGSFILSTSTEGVIRIWSPDFSSLKSEVKTGHEISWADINYDCNQIVVFSASQSTISILDLQQASYNVILRSHQDSPTDVCHNQMTNKLVTIGKDYCVKVWNAETMEQLNEFISENDLPTKVVCQNQGFLGDPENLKTSDSDTLLAIGFRSGFFRVIDLENMEVVYEILLFQSPVLDIQFSQDNKFIAIYFKSGKVVLINKQRRGAYQPIKNIDVALPFHTYCSLAFSPDSSLLANVSSNGNTITVWETRNFSLRYELDITGDLITKIAIAPNGKDLLLLTTTSKVKIYRLGCDSQQLEHVKDCYSVTQFDCSDFQISDNNRFLIFSSLDGKITFYDYFMRGAPAQQSFSGHFKSIQRFCISKDMRNIFTVGEFNGIFKWSFHGDASIPRPSIIDYFEALENQPINSKTNKINNQSVSDQNSQQNIMNDPEDNLDIDNGVIFGQEQLTKLSQQQIENQKQQPGSISINHNGYVYERFTLSLSKVLSCSNSPSVKNNLVWLEANRYIAYTTQNIIVIEQLSTKKTQKLLKEGNDQIYSLKLSPSKRFLLGYSKTGPLDGFPTIYIFDAITFVRINQIAVNDTQIDSVEFSGFSNMLLVISSTRQGEEEMTTLSVWDFMDGHRDIFCKSNLNLKIRESCWNPYLQKNADEFVTISKGQYHYWRISEALQLQYQEGELPTKDQSFIDKEDSFTSLCFVKPDQLHHSVYLMLGLQSGYVWVTDTRVNQFLFKVKVLDNTLGSIQRIFSSHSRIVIEPQKGSKILCWDQSGKNGDKEYSAYNPFNFFAGVESSLTIDGEYVSTYYDDTGNQIMALSSSGSIWYLSWIEEATLKLKSCHSPSQSICACDFKYVSPSQFQIEEEEDQMYQFDQNYLISTSSNDGIMKIWRMYDLEFEQQFIVPQEKCIALAMHQFKPYMIAAFSDGFIRFFDLESSKLLGRCQVHAATDDHKLEEGTYTEKLQAQQPQIIKDNVINLKILPSGNHIYAATKNGQVILISVSSWTPLAIKMQQLISINTGVNSFDFSYLEPYNKWLIATSSGKILVYNRKGFNSLSQEVFDVEKSVPVFTYMDNFNVLDFVSNGFIQTQRCNTLDHYYSMAKKTLVYNEVAEQHECEAVFSKNDLTLHLGFIRKSNMLFIRNFELHQIVKRIELSSSAVPKAMALMPAGSSPFICVAMTDNSLKLVDYMNEDNWSSVQTLHDNISSFKVCPNGRYVLTGGSQGDISLWAINKQIASPYVMNSLK